MNPIELDTSLLSLLPPWYREVLDYQQICLTEQQQFEALAEERDGLQLRRALTLSQGTADQLYLAVRLAVCELVLPAEEPCPLVLDDALANFDDGRCALALEALARVGLADKCKNLPSQLSGGQQQRVSIARALAGNPSVILADEPTGALDSHSAQMLLSTIQSINEQLGATILMVTHDAFTASYCRRILFIKDGRPFTELVRGASGRKDFFARIIEVVTLLGGDSGDVL